MYTVEAPSDVQRKFSMSVPGPKFRLFLLTLIVLILPSIGGAYPQSATKEEDEFGPVVRAYLGYLKNEQEVVDDRVSRHEVSPTYYRRNSNRIRALRQIAVRIARETGNDYLPELEAVTRDEMGLLFERPPQPQGLKVGEVVRGTFRFVGSVRTSEVFYVFARLDPYEQLELRQRQPSEEALASPSAPAVTRERRVTVP